MKHPITIIALSLVIITLLSSCFEKEAAKTENPTSTVAEEADDLSSQDSSSNEEIGDPIIEPDYVLGNLIINDFAPMQSYNSPMTLTGKAPRVWFFEGVFPVTLMTLDEEIITEGYASGPWLETVGESDELGADDMIEFTSTIEYTLPDDFTGEAKLRFTQDNTSGEAEDVYTEQQIILN